MFTETCLEHIRKRTEPGTYALHVWDNGSDAETQDWLVGQLRAGVLTSLHLDSRNTGCTYPKASFHMQALGPYYCVNDADVYPPDTTTPMSHGAPREPDWLASMIGLMEAYPEIAILSAQLPPQSFQKPLKTLEKVVYCEAVGNTCKLVRRAAIPVTEFKPELMKAGDDWEMCQWVRRRGLQVAFARNVYCYHAGQCPGWGYTDEQIKADPRKAGYGKPYTYGCNETNWVPDDPALRM